MKHTRLTAILLLFALLLSLAGCADRPTSEPTPEPEAPASSDLMAEITPSDEADAPEIPSDNIGQAGFAVRLLQNSLADGENTLVSPLSVLSALAMTANGAKGDTLTEMEAALGVSADALNAYFHSLREKLAEDRDGLRFHLANSIWFTDDERFTVNRDFLQTNADYYGAGIYRAPFDEGTLREINDWVRDNTDGMIPAILDEIPDTAVMYLINALAFEGEWVHPYYVYQVFPGEFTREDGEKKTVDLMHAEEHVYLEDGDAAVGFIKYYQGRQYAFAALLPKEGTSVADYVNTLDGERLLRVLASSRFASVETAMPKFEAEYSTELSEVLAAMGMPTAFDRDAADFTGIGTSAEGNIYINRVLHKTFIAVDELGTKAGAATAVEAVAEEAMIVERQRVILDRPFVYMLIDCETNLPFFLGVLADIVE
jgi:Serine protease inhibitor